MSSSSDESEAPPPPATSSWKQNRVALGKKCFGRRKSTAGAIDASQSLPNPPHSDSLQTTTSTDQKHIHRSKSNAGLPDHRNDWASVLMAQGPMQDSIISLRESVDLYEKEAGKDQLGDLLRVRADLTELTKLASTALKKEHLKTPGLTGLEKFSTVAVEYSKLLDVVMNQSPEYACLAWGVIKLLLVANVNHAKLKQNVEIYLLKIGNQLGLVNQLMYYMPTEKIVEAVALLYASFSRFLRKALKCYAKSRLATVIGAFAFPWETKFQPLIHQIDLRFVQIHELANAGHIHATLQNQNLLYTLHSGQREIQQTMDGNSEALRKEIKEEMKREIFGLLQTFDAKWIQRFDELLVQQAQPLLLEEERTADDYVDSFTQLALPCPKPETFLADFVSTGKKLRRFRDMTYSELEEFDQEIKNVRLRHRHLTVNDYQQCVGLLRHDKVIAWVSTNESSILWVNTYRIFGSADWATAFAARLIDHSAHLDYLTILYHFCTARSSSSSASTPIIIVKSIIFQVLLRHRKRFLSRSKRLTLERFNVAGNNMSELWALFLDILRIAKADCTWIVIDSIETLQVESSSQTSQDALMLLRYLNALADDDSVTIKVFVTARHAGSSKFFSTNLESGDLMSPRHPILHIPRGQTRAMASMWARTSRKTTRLPESTIKIPLENPTALASAESLLFGPEKEIDEISIPKPTNKTIEHLKESQKLDEDSDSPDSLASFIIDDPFYSSDDDGGSWMAVDKTTTETHASHCSSRASFVDSTDDDFAANMSPGGKFIVSGDEDSSEDEEVPLTAKPAFTSGENGKDEKSHAKDSGQNDLLDDSDSDDVFSSGKMTL